MIRRRLVLALAVVLGALGIRRLWAARAPSDTRPDDARPEPSAAAAGAGTGGGSEPVGADRARALVEPVLGRRPDRRPLTVDFAPALATCWELLIDGPSFFPRMLADIEAARSDVHILIFGFKPGAIGNRFEKILVDKVAEGVSVRLSVEGGYSQPRLGSWPLYARLLAGGVQVVANQGLMLDLDGLLGSRRVDWRFDDLGHFDHRKLVVIDGRVAFVGGPGIEDHYADDEFHDVMFRLEGPIVTQLQAVFLLSWHFQGGPLPATADGLDRFFPDPPAGDGVPMEVLLNNPGERHLPIAPAFRAAIEGARRRLYVINPYLADRTIIRGILDAAGRGAEVRVIVPADPRSLPASGAVRHWFPAFAAAGIDIREHPKMAHAKVVLADDTVLAGTANLDGLSLRHNWELQLRVDDPAVAEHVARELFDRDLQVASPARMPAGRRERAVNATMSRLYSLL